jgi:hypothetical protein
MIVNLFDEQYDLTIFKIKIANNLISMMINKDYGKIPNESVVDLCLKLTTKIDCDVHAKSQMNLHSCKTFDFTQIHELMDDNEFCICGQFVFDKYSCAIDMHHINPAFWCNGGIQIQVALILWTNKCNLIVVTLTNIGIWHTPIFKFICEKIKNGFDAILNKHIVDLIKMQCFDIDVFNGRSQHFAPTALEQGKHKYRLLIEYIKTLIDKHDKSELENSQNGLLEHETQTAFETKLKVEIEQLKLELETTKLELAKSKHKSDKLSIIKTKFDELFDTF